VHVEPPRSIGNGRAFQKLPREYGQEYKVVSQTLDKRNLYEAGVV
jgi:hypothetical protein